VLVKPDEQRTLMAGVLEVEIPETYRRVVCWGTVRSAGPLVREPMAPGDRVTIEPRSGPARGQEIIHLDDGPAIVADEAVILGVWLDEAGVDHSTTIQRVWRDPGPTE